MIDKLIRIAKRVWRYRSSITGLFVSKAHADANPDTTQRERGK